MRTIEYRTALVTDDEAIARLDVLLADHVSRVGATIGAQAEQAIDAIVDQIDPGALRRSRKTTCNRDVQFGSPSDEAGYTSMWARLYGPDAVVLEQRVEQMVRSVCEDDPRTLGERRSEALPAIAAGFNELACQCGSADCAAAARNDSRPATAVVHVVAEAATVEAARSETVGGTPPDTGPDSGDDAPDSEDAPRAPAAKAQPAANDAAPPPALCREPDADHAVVPPAFSPQPATESTALSPACCPAPPAFVIGGGVLPAPLLAATLERATMREIRHPGDAPPEPRYAPSRALADFVRCRDLTCRWPGCDKPAYGCDVDHTVPYPIGPTHASNIKCYCRFHHLLKTFWCGVDGWREQQLPDGTLTLTSPTGHTYTTYPGSKRLFPALCEPTGTLWTGEPPTVDTIGDRGVMMPKRRHTRAENLQRRVEAERKLNDEYVAERNKPPPF